MLQLAQELYRHSDGSSQLVARASRSPRTVDLWYDIQSYSSSSTRIDIPSQILDCVGCLDVVGKLSCEVDLELVPPDCLFRQAQEGLRALPGRLDRHSSCASQGQISRGTLLWLLAVWWLVHFWCTFVRLPDESALVRNRACCAAGTSIYD